ncbi:MAG: hypothetical protein RSB98_00810 [Raoultibacter sp.]
MRVVSVGDIEHKMECNAFTPIVYSGEFKVDKPNGGKRPKDISEAIGVIAESLSYVGIPAITPLLEIFWAFEKTADQNLEGFSEWLGKFPTDAYDMTRGDGWASDVMKLVEANFFPGQRTNVDAKAAEAPDATSSGRDKE